MESLWEHFGDTLGSLWDHLDQIATEPGLRVMIFFGISRINKIRRKDGLRITTYQIAGLIKSSGLAPMYLQPPLELINFQPCICQVLNKVNSFRYPSPSEASQRPDARGPGRKILEKFRKKLISPMDPMPLAASCMGGPRSARRPLIPPCALKQSPKSTRWPPKGMAREKGGQDANEFPCPPSLLRNV